MTHLFRLFKIALGVTLLGLSLWAILLPPYFPSSSHAIVNTKKVFVTSQTDGVISALQVAVRSEVTKGQAIATIDQDQTSLQQEIERFRFGKKRLETQLANAEKRFARRSEQLKVANAEYIKLQTKTIETLQYEFKGLSDKVAIEQKEYQFFTDGEKHIKGLMNKSIVTRSKWLEASKLSLESAKRLQSARSEAKRVESQLELAQAGLYLAQTDGNNVLTTEIATMQHEIRDLESERSNLGLKLAETNALIDTSLTSLKSLESLSISSPTEGMVWACQGVEGQNVSTGQSIAQIADSQSVVVESFFHRYYQESVFPGDFAFVQLRGEGVHLRGRVVDVQVQENVSDNTYVIDTVAPSSSMLRVIIKLDENSVSVDKIGKLGKVVVTSGQPGFIKQQLVWFSMLLRNQS